MEVTLAIGRVLRMLWGEVPYDAEMWWACRDIIMDASPGRVDYEPNWARDRLKGSAGD